MWWVRFIPSHVLFIVNSNSENVIKIRWFFHEVTDKNKLALFFMAHGVFWVVCWVLCSEESFLVYEVFIGWVSWERGSIANRRRWRRSRDTDGFRSDDKRRLRLLEEELRMAKEATVRLHDDLMQAEERRQRHQDDLDRVKNALNESESRRLCLQNQHDSAQTEVSTVTFIHRSLGSRPSDHYLRSVCLSVCLCRVFLSRLWADFDQTWTHVICLGLVVSPRI